MCAIGIFIHSNTHLDRLFIKIFIKQEEKQVKERKTESIKKETEVPLKIIFNLLWNYFYAEKGVFHIKIKDKRLKIKGLEKYTKTTVENFISKPFLIKEFYYYFRI